MSIVLYLVTVFIALFAMVNPIGALPVLVSVTEGYTQEDFERVVRYATMSEALMLFSFMLIGIYIFEVLGININDFKVAGGVLLFKVAFDMLQGRTSTTKLTPVEKEESIERTSIGIAPIGTPLLAGPGSITAAIIYFNSYSVNVPEKIVVIIAVLLVVVLSYFILHFSSSIFKYLGKTGSLIISRIMGLLLAAIAVDFMVTGLAFIVKTIMGA
ncbi:MarC family protein [Thermoplasma sp. Kam2015]|uniref:MarC family protein n=1 Tax=Thermoplasma sp. Kam2015 TaxID=2094122 RepID=UPI000D84504B|nr:MarC family protein [Thermoplasma sp. Kam2015]PYB69194.1 MarC family protein [Thermoplasma sp. Kam2015]